MEMIKQAIDEIALSGLQGVTIPNLWQFLMEVKPPLLKDGSDEELKAFLWKGILRCKEIEFYFFDADNTLQGSEKDKFFKKGNLTFALQYILDYPNLDYPNLDYPNA